MADPDIKRKIRVKTEDGATDVIGVHTIEVTNGDLSNDGGGVVSIDTSGGGGGGDTYTLQAETKTGGTTVPLKLDANTGSDSTVNLVQGTNITLTRDSATQITIDGAATPTLGDLGGMPLYATIRIVEIASDPSLKTIQLTDAGGVILVDTSGGTINMQLQAAVDGFQCVLINTGANPLTIDSSVLNADINGIGTVTVTNQYDAATLIVSAAANTAFAIGV